MKKLLALILVLVLCLPAMALADVLADDWQDASMEELLDGTARSCTMTRRRSGSGASRMPTALKGYASTICGIRMPPYCWRITLTPWPSPHAWATPMPASRCAYTPTRCAAAMKMQRRPRKACLIAPSWGKNWGIKKNSGAPFPAHRQRSAPVRDAFFSPKLPQFSPNSLIARWKSRVFDAL